MLTLRQRIFLIIGVVLAALSLILSAGYYLNKRPATTIQVEDKNTAEVKPADNLQPTKEKVDVSVVGAKPAVPSGGGDIYMRQLAAVFVERFSSYSNQNDNKHIEDSLVLATSAMQSWMKKQGLVQSLEYKGVETKVVSSSILNKTENKAVVVFSAQQVVEKEEGKIVQKEVKQRNGKVELIKVSNNWKVNGMWWE